MESKVKIDNVFVENHRNRDHVRERRSTSPAGRAVRRIAIAVKIVPIIQASITACNGVIGELLMDSLHVFSYLKRKLIMQIFRIIVDTNP